METSNNPGLEDTHAPACSPAGKATKSHARSAKLKATLRAAAIVLPQQLLHTGMGIPPAPSICPIVKEGYLMKLEHKPPLGTIVWRRRFCILSRGTLYFYKSEHSDGAEKSSGCLVLSEFARCQPSRQRRSSTRGGFALLQRSPSTHSTKTSKKQQTKEDTGLDDVSVQFTLFPLDPAKRRKLYEYGNVTFSAESHEEMEEWVIQIQRFIYEGDGCSSEQVRRDEEKPLETPCLQKSNEEGVTLQTDRGDRQLPGAKTSSSDDIIVSEAASLPLLQNLVPVASSNSKQNKPPQKQPIVSAYAYSSSDDEESDSLADSLSPNLINEAIGRFQTAQAIPAAQSHRLANRTAVARRNVTTASQQPFVERAINSVGDSLDHIKTLNESDDSDCSATVLDCKTATTNRENYKSVQGPFTVVRQQHASSNTFRQSAPDDENLKDLVAKLERSSNLIRRDLSAAKGDLGNVNAGLCSIQKTADQVVEKLNKFNLKMFDLENQSTLLLKNLSQKSAIMDKKLAEVDVYLNHLRTTTSVDLKQVDLTHNGNKPRLGDNNFGSLPSANRTGVGKKAKNRHSVQICQDPAHLENGEMYSMPYSAAADVNSMSLPSPKSQAKVRTFSKTTEIAFI